MLQYSSKEVAAEDLTTYWGRFKYFQHINNPFNLFVSNKRCKQYSQILSQCENDHQIRQQYTNEQLWKIRYIVDANIHPQLKEPIILFFRASSMVPMSIPICYFLTVLPPTPINQFIAQSLNQTYNFMFNYCNRNASNSFTPTMLLISYSGAVSSAIIGSLGTSWLFKKLNAPKLLIRACPLFGVWIANTLNLLFARTPDFQNGIAIYDKETNDYIGKSKLAATIAFYKTLITRLILPIPCFLPPIAAYYLKKNNFYPITKRNRIIVDLSLAGIFIYAGLSFGIALFPQYLNVNSQYLEEQFQKQYNSNGNPISQIVFNKGL